MDTEEKKYHVRGKLLKIAYLKDEWFSDCSEPDMEIENLKNASVKADIFSFWQRLPNTELGFNYHYDLDNVAAIPLTSFDNWWKNQISGKTRNATRKSEKKGVIVSEIDFNDELIFGIKEIFDETPVRQGKYFWHYQKSLAQIKNELSDRLKISKFIGAFYKEKLIGFIKLLELDNYMMCVEILSMIKHRDKSTTNALLAKAVELSVKNSKKYLVYSKWSDGSLGQFKSNTGFIKFELPRYYIPLNQLGKLGIKFKLYKELKEFIPYALKKEILNIRKIYFEKFRYKYD